ncbi:MAG: cation:proton antiporter, partial [Oceanisphaera sp.]|nr:cation:proton antiporter [Oceanisphaera sp.]
MNPAILILALLAGLAFRRIGYPPLLGYLIAGFMAHALGQGDVAAIKPIANLGVTLLLFTIGLKIQLRELIQPQVWGVASLHMLIVAPLTAALIIAVSYLVPTLALPNHTAALTLAFALTFSSTVFAVKVFEERGESAALYAKIAIGILIIQDIMAVAYLVFSADKLPSVAAIGLLALPLLRPLLQRLLHMAGHGELLVLFGIALALAASALFREVDLKGGLGALLAGMLLANSEKATELYKSLSSL